MLNTSRISLDSALFDPQNPAFAVTESAGGGNETGKESRQAYGEAMGRSGKGDPQFHESRPMDGTPETVLEHTL